MLSVSNVSLPASVNPSISVQGAQPQLAKKFQESLKAARGAAEIKPPNNVYQDLVSMQNRILQGELIAPQELIVYQIRAGEFNLRVELVSKVAESIMTTFRKFQNSQ